MTFQRAAEWLSKTDIVAAEFVEDDTTDTVPWVKISERQRVEQAREITGAIFTIDLDQSHPIAFGHDQSANVFKTRYSVLKPPTKAGTTVAVYQRSPLASGYAPADRLDSLSATQR